MGKFTADQFTPTECTPAAEKAAFANWLVKFITGGYQRKSFSKKRYRQLRNCFGHIAHYDISGFYSVKFEGLGNQHDFLQGLMPLMRHSQNDNPDYTFSDVERVIQDWMRNSKILDQAVATRDAEFEQAERAMLAKLKAKYEG
jgi:hypothetical protein